MKLSRRLWVALAIVAGVAVVGDARADIPYPEQITPGLPRAIALREGSAWNLGYWEYLPGDYDADDENRRYPLLVFLGGLGMSDDASECPGDADVCWESQCWGFGDGLCRNLRRGPALLMWEDEWDDTARPFIYISPQNLAPTISTEEWHPDELDAFLDFVVENYPVDTRRMYLIGMSQGGRGVLQYTAAYPRRFTAVAPAPGGGVTPDVACWFEDTGFWAFHGEDDADANLGTGVFDPCWMARQVNMYENPQLYANEFERCAERVDEPHPPGRMTMIYNWGHNAWTAAYDPLGVGFVVGTWASDQGCNAGFEYREYTPDLDPDGLYSWFLELDRPDVIAPDDFEVQPGAVEITAVVVDDDAVEYTWTQLEGPAATLETADGPTLRVSGLELGQTYAFEVLALDADNQWDRDDVAVTVVEEVPGDGTTGTGGDGEGGDTGADDPDGDGDGHGDTGGETSGSMPTTGSLGSEAGGDEADEASDNAPADASCSCSAPSEAAPVGLGLLLLVLAFRRRSSQSA